MNQIFYWWC